MQNTNKEIKETLSLMKILKTNYEIAVQAEDIISLVEISEILDLVIEKLTNILAENAQ